jgi:hypothetical protein
MVFSEILVKIWNKQFKISNIYYNDFKHPIQILSLLFHLNW